jgi:hypothetical protein
MASYFTSNHNAALYLNSNPEDFDLFVMSDIDYNEPDDIAIANNAANIVADILINNKNETLNQLNYNWPSANEIKAKITNAISKGVYTTAKYARNYLYLPLQKVSNKYPSTINWSNKVIDAVRIDAVAPLVNFNTNTMGWGDLFNIWMFELTPGHFSNNTLNFTGVSNVISGNNIFNPTTNAVINFPKGDWKDISVNPPTQIPFIDKLKSTLNNSNVLAGTTLEGYFTYNVNAFYSTLSNGNVGIQMLGSFPIKSTVISKSGNTAIIEFYIHNNLGWESGTRFIKGENGGSNQGVIDNKTVGSGLHLGGTITNTFTWRETIDF